MKSSAFNNIALTPAGEKTLIETNAGDQFAESSFTLEDFSIGNINDNNE